MVADINATGSGLYGAGDTIVELDSKLYFPGNDGEHGDELWVYDPASGTSRVASFNDSGGNPMSMF